MYTFSYYTNKITTLTFKKKRDEILLMQLWSIIDVYIQGFVCSAKLIDRQVWGT